MESLDSRIPISDYLYATGAAAPVLGYGALNSLLFMTYNRSLRLFDPSINDPTILFDTSLSKIWVAGSLGGLASWIVSAPSELVKCRTQLCVDGESSSWAVCKQVLKAEGVKGLYLGGMVTSIRDSVGYGFYFWSYELSKRTLDLRHEAPPQSSSTIDILVSGGIAGVITWVSIYPLDVIKTRIQAQRIGTKVGESTHLLPDIEHRKGLLSITRETYRNDGLLAFYRGLGVCSFRAFIVNAVQVPLATSCDFRTNHTQWYTYEKMMKMLFSI